MEVEAVSEFEVVMWQVHFGEKKQMVLIRLTSVEKENDEADPQQ